MAKYTSADGRFSSDNPTEVNDYNNNQLKNGGGAAANTNVGAQPDNPHVSGVDSIGVAYGGSNPGTRVPGHPGLTIGPTGRVDDLNPNEGAGTGTQYNAHNTGDFGNLQGAFGVDATGNVVVNSQGDGQGTNTNAGMAPTTPTMQVPSTTGTSGGNQYPNTAPGTLTPGMANVGDLLHRDPRDFEYGRQPGYGAAVVGQARTQAQNFGNEMRGLGAQSAATGDQYGTQAASAGQRGMEVGAGVQNDLRGQGQGAADVGDQYALQTASAGQRAQEVGAGAQNELRGQGQSAADYGAGAGRALTGLESTEGPSAAQAQLAQATSQGLNDSMRVAGSGRGLGGNAAALSQAIHGMPQQQAAAANASAQLRANENALWRSRQASNMTNAAGITQQGINQQLNATQAGANLAQSGASTAAQAAQGAGQTALAGRSQQIGATQAGGNAAQAGTGQALQGATAGGQLALAGQGQQQNAVGQGQNQFWQGESLADKVTGNQSQQDLSYENMLTQEKGINAGIAINAANNQQSIWPAVIGAGATAAAMMSDERQKDIISPVKLSSAIHGNPYGRTGAPGKNMRDASGPADRSDLTPYGHAGYGAFNDAQAGMQGAQDKEEALSRARLGNAIKSFGSIAQGMATPRHNDGAAGMKMVNEYAPRPVMSDERSKDKIADLEGQLAQFRSATSGPAATAGVQSRPVDTSALDLAKARGAGAPNVPDFTQAPASAYTYKDPSMPGAAPGVQVGPMAQGLERAGSNAVMNTPQGKMVDPGRLTMENSSAIGEQQAHTADLQRQFDELEAMIKSSGGKRGRQGASAGMR